MTSTDAEEWIRANVSRETLEKLERFRVMVEQWSGRVNLIGRSTRAQIWRRHIWDSLQAVHATHLSGHWVDVGTGAGFPGLVIAIYAQERAQHLRCTLVESDRRKVSFLQAVARDLSLDVRVIRGRVEEIDPLDADILSARAVAALDRLLEYAQRHLAETGVALFFKGSSWRTEVRATEHSWMYSYDPIPSETEPAAVILKIKGIRRVTTC